MLTSPEEVALKKRQSMLYRLGMGRLKAHHAKRERIRKEAEEKIRFSFVAQRLLGQG